MRGVPRPLHSCKRRASAKIPAMPLSKIAFIRSTVLFILLGMAALLVIGGAAPSRADVMVGARTSATEAPNWKPTLLAFEASIGRPLAIDSDYNNWAAFPDPPRIAWDLRNGRLPMQSWNVQFQSSDPNVCATAAAINAGTYDTQLDRQAAALKALGGTILVRFNDEMTGAQEHTCFTGFPISQNVPLAGQEFIAAWRHVVGRFRAAGATNVKWVWAPGAGAFLQGIWRLFYPGDAWVDWIAVDDYNIVDTPTSFGDDPGITEFYAATAPLGKPLMISENAAFNDPTLNPDAQTMWVQTARAFIKSHPAIVAYVYWDCFSPNNPPPPPPYHGSGYILNGLGLAAFRALANDPYFMAPGGP